MWARASPAWFSGLSKANLLSSRNPPSVQLSSRKPWQ
uniref:Uncharacterized protein n=1 Tax=Arundo donax TaxID=35708 RepID=A0A0A8YZ78_ARUDO